MNRRQVANQSWVRNEIDAFILAKLEQEKIAPSPEADRRTLIRRLSFDLLGLPPTPQEVDDFLDDKRPDAYERLVDRLLASPHFGERWGRHWLDLARYADSSGCVIDLARPFAWRWRDWVIEAINNDLPFDQFTIEQIAGDLLPNATLDSRIAVGLPSKRAQQSRSRHRFGSRARENHARSHRRGRHGMVGFDGRLRPVPFAQIRSDFAGRLLPAVCFLRQSR